MNEGTSVQSTWAIWSDNFCEFWASFYRNMVEILLELGLNKAVFRSARSEGNSRMIDKTKINTVAYSYLYLYHIFQNNVFIFGYIPNTYFL